MKYIVLLVQFFTITVYSFLFTDPVTITTNAQQSAVAGTEFPVEFTINKGSIAGFAKFQVELPEGLSAREGESKGGSFSISGQNAKIIWTSIPSDASFTIRLMVSSAASVSGEKTITGKYSYIENNNKQQVDFAPVKVKITSGVANSENTTSSETPSVTTNAPKEGQAEVLATRTITPGKSPDEYLIEVLIKKEGVSGFAKLQDKIPEGYFASGHNEDGGTFSYSSSEHAAKFIWTSLPSKEELRVKYKIMPKQEAKHDQNALLEGEFSYLEGGKPLKVFLQSEGLNGTMASPDTATPKNSNQNNTAVVNQQLPADTAKVSPDNSNSAQTSTIVTTDKNTETSSVKSDTAVTQNQQVENVGKQVQENSDKGTKTEEKIVSDVPSAKTGQVMYCIQVGAFRKDVNVAALSRKYSISGIRTEMQDGYTKCLVGSQQVYKSARDDRERIRVKNGVADAFVAAYNGGKRITVQEALMISTQKWFR